MSQIDFHFKGLKPLPLNNMYASGKNGRRFKSKRAVDFEKHMACELFQRKPDIFVFENSVSEYENFLCCQITCYIPRSKLFTKKGPISLTSGDVDNFAKPIIDNVFKFFDKLNDAIICQTNIIKAPSPDNNYGIYINLIRQDLDLLDKF